MPLITVRFDIEDRLNRAPDFQLFSASRQWVSFVDLYTQGSLILMFLHPPDETTCQQFLSSMQSRREDYQHLDARVVIIFPSPAIDLPAPSSESAFIFLADPLKTTRQAYTNLMAPGLIQESDVMLFVLDGYGGIYSCLVGEEPDISAHDELLNWLNFISIQCPE